MITKEKFLEKCVPLYPDYDFSNINYINYTTPIEFICKKHNKFTKAPYQLYQGRSGCPECGKEASSIKNKINATERLAKARKTCLERYGVDNPYKSEEIKNKIKKIQIERYGGIGSGSIEIAAKIAKTKEERYGDPTFTNREKCKKTVQERYGVDNVYSLESVKEKKKETYLEKFGVDCPFKSIECMEKAKQTMLSRYGYDNYGKSEESKAKLHSEEVKQKRRQSLHDHGTYGKSQSEDRCYELLSSIYPNTKRQFESDLYPFACDIYVPEIELYIELNFFWTHNDHFYNKDDLNDIKILKELESKDTDFYKTAIWVWTQSDPKKLKTAIDNKLNYLVFWSEKEFTSFFNRDFSKVNHIDFLLRGEESKMTALEIYEYLYSTI